MTTHTTRRGAAVRRTRVARAAARRTRLVRAAAALSAVVVLTACGGDEPVTPVLSPPLLVDDPGGPDVPDHLDLPALAARALRDLDVHEEPDGEVTHHLGAATGFGSPSTLLVTRTGSGVESGWLEVSLPVRPNGTTGWIRADEVELRELDLRVEVDLDARTLTVVDRDGEVVLSTPTAIGDADHPTPTGTFFITDKLDTGDPAGPYGPYAIGLSARSDVLTEFAGGDGQVGIHGTNAPSSIGQPASHGCLRVPNGVVEQLAHLLPLGTPVAIT